jgi:hypothetical protein
MLCSKLPARIDITQAERTTLLKLGVRLGSKISAPMPLSEGSTPYHARRSQPLFVSQFRLDVIIETCRGRTGHVGTSPASDPTSSSLARMICGHRRTCKLDCSRHVEPVYLFVLLLLAVVSHIEQGNENRWSCVLLIPKSSMSLFSCKCGRSGRICWFPHHREVHWQCRTQ